MKSHCNTTYFWQKWRYVWSSDDPSSEKEGELGKQIFAVLVLSALESIYKLYLSIASDCGCCGLEALYATESL